MNRDNEKMPDVPDSTITRGQARDLERHAFDFEAHLRRQREFSERTFGPGTRIQCVVEHIRKELHEINAAPYDLSEWIDVVILALDGAWRSGAEPHEIIAALVAKQAKNEARAWPDWRTADPSKAIEHDRSGDHVPMAYAAREPGKPGYVAVCADEPRYAKDIAAFIAENVAEGYLIEHVTRSVAVAGFQEGLDVRPFVC